MSEIKKPISAGKKYVLRVMDLAKRDRYIGDRMPNPSVWGAAAKEGLSQDKVIDAFLDGYAERPALGERPREDKGGSDGLANTSAMPCSSR